MSSNVSSTQTQSGSDEKEWKGIKLTPIKVEDGTNNYSEFKRKAQLDLYAAGYWRYIDGPDYKPPVIPELRQTMKVQGLDSTGAAATFTVPGNEAQVEAAKKKAEAWLFADQRALSIIIKAIPVNKMFITQDCTSAHDAWFALKKHFEPANALYALGLRNQIAGYHCLPGMDPVQWREVMIQLYGRLQDANPGAMPDAEFAKNLVAHMSESEEWRYCRDDLRKSLRMGEMLNKPLSSTEVIDRLMTEEVEMKIAPAVASANALIAASIRTQPAEQAVPGVYSANQATRQDNRALQRAGKRPTPYNPQQRSRFVCENSFCETPLGHTKDNCFAYGGGKAGQYPAGFRGRKDVHLAPQARIAARRKQILEGAKTGGTGSRFAGMSDVVKDKQAEVNEVATMVGEGGAKKEEVFGSIADEFAFMFEVQENDVGDEIGIDEEVRVNAAALNPDVAQDDSVNHDTGASRHIFHRRELFGDYVPFDVPLNVHGFGANLSAQAVGKGKVVMKATYDGTTRHFSISNALHIPTARCNLISGSRLDRKGVNTRTGNGKIIYLNSADVPFASGGIVKDLYKMDVQTVEAADSGPGPDLIAASVPSVTSLFGPGVDNDEAKQLGFIIV